MEKPAVIFVIDKELDVKNHLIQVATYKRRKGTALQRAFDPKLEAWSAIESRDELAQAIANDLEPLYTKRATKLAALAADMNAEWGRIEKEFFSRLERVFKHPFPFPAVKGVLSAAQGFGYNWSQDGWFATSMFRNKFYGVDTAMHELTHFMFHEYYDQECRERGLSESAMWDIKESFTVLLNLEFDDLRLLADPGYTPHKAIREAITQSWLADHDFEKALTSAIKEVGKSS